MAPQRQLVWSNGATITQKLHLTFKLMQLENARITLEEELRNFTAKASEDVRDCLSSSLSPNMFHDVEKSLGVKQEFIRKLSALLQKLTSGRDMCVQLQVINNPLKTYQPFRELMIPDALKVLPMLKNGNNAKTILKPTLLLGMSLSLLQEKHVFYIQPNDLQNQGVVSRYDVSVATSKTSFPLKPKEKGSDITEKGLLPDVVQVSLISQSSEVGGDLVPYTPPILEPEVSDANLLEGHDICNWGSADGVAVHHQIQTSSQLQHFFRDNVKTSGPLEVTVIENSDRFWAKSEFHQPKSCDLNDIDACSLKPVPSIAETQVPVFRVKGSDSTGFLTYSCVIATNTELWDVMDICTDVREGSADEGFSGDDSDVNNQPQDCILSCSKSVGINSFTIPDFEIKNFEETEVVVSHVVNPGNFYIQNVDFSTKHQSFITGACKPSASYAEQNCIPDIGTRVMCWFPKQEQWCRARVTKICGVTQDNEMNGGLEGSSIVVEVKRLDYGDTSCLSLWNIQELTSDMAKLPLQALKVSLANVVPVDGTGWSEDAVGWFKEMTRSRMFYARFYSEDSCVTVELFLEKGTLGAMRRGFSLSLRLTQNGHATHSTLKNGRVRTSNHLKKKQDSEWEKYLISCYTQRKVLKL